MKRKRARVFFSLVKLRLLNHTVFRTFENGVRLEMLASVSSQCLFTTQYPLYYTIHGTLFTAHGARLETLARPFVRKRQTIDLAAGLLHHVCMYVSMYVCVFTQTHANTKQLIL